MELGRGYKIDKKAMNQLGSGRLAVVNHRAGNPLAGGGLETNKCIPDGSGQFLLHRTQELAFLLRAGLEILKRWQAGKPIGFDDEATATFPCPNCKWTLLYGMERCDSCGIAIDQDEAYESALIRYFINRAIAWANTLFTMSAAGAVLFGVSVLLHILGGYKIYILLMLLITLLYTASIAAWSYRHADLQVAHPGFRAVQKRMKCHLHFWLAATSVQVILLILRW